MAFIDNNFHLTLSSILFQIIFKEFKEFSGFKLPVLDSV